MAWNKHPFLSTLQLFFRNTIAGGPSKLCSYGCSIEGAIKALVMRAIEAVTFLRPRPSDLAYGFVGKVPAGGSDQHFERGVRARLDMEARGDLLSDRAERVDKV